MQNVKEFKRKNHPLRSCMHKYIYEMKRHKLVMEKVDRECQDVIKTEKLNPVLTTDNKKIDELVEKMAIKHKVDESQQKINAAIFKMFETLRVFLKMCTEESQSTFLLALYLRATKDTKKGGYGLNLGLLSHLTLEKLLNDSNENRWLENAIIDTIEYDLLRPTEGLKK